MSRNLAKLAMLATLLAWAVAARAQDTVVLRPPDKPRSQIKLTGEVLDYTGRALTLRVDGSERRIPAEQVVDVQTSWTPAQIDADRLLAEHRYEAAVQKYLEAAKLEQRRWVRRKILAQLVRCETALGHLTSAGDYFIGLVREDPQTPYFDVAPLAWTTAEISPALEQKALAWLSREDTPAAVLLGASHLLGTSQRATALERLASLAAGDDSLIAPLAEAQRWRVTHVTATPQQVLDWRGVVERVPPTLRAGPYLALGRALAYHRNYEDAELALLRVPILYADQPRLASAALWETARTFKDANDPTTARQMLVELVTRYPDAPDAAAAREELKTKGVAE